MTHEGRGRRARAEERGKGRPRLPEHLVNAILEGRCVAFVGAGFSAMVTPTWRSLLEQLAVRLGVDIAVPKDGSGFDYEIIAHVLQEAAGARWEPVLKEVLDAAERAASPAQRAQRDERCRLLGTIPFRAILTTNFDRSLQGSATDPAIRARLLRADDLRWSDVDGVNRRRAPTPVVKLHGEANGDPSVLPVVLSRTAYRGRLYDDHHYTNLIRAIFAGYTILFLGVSFTDAYLNELRSEVLSLIGGGSAAARWGYSIQCEPAPHFKMFLEQSENIGVIEIATFAEFDEVLADLSATTSVEGRLHTLLDDQRVIWVDKSPAGNEEGLALLAKVGARVEVLRSPDQLDEARHRDAALLITSFGHESQHGLRALATLRGWADRPPAIVFADPDPVHLVANRRACLRAGAFEYTVHWSELYRAIDQVLGRVPGTAAVGV